MFNPFFKNDGPFKLAQILNDLNLKIDENNKDLKVIDIKDLQNSKAQEITLNRFISVSCRALNEILKLNYHSVARFKSSASFKKFEECVDLKDLLTQFGDKGCH